MLYRLIRILIVLSSLTLIMSCQESFKKSPTNSRFPVSASEVITPIPSMTQIPSLKGTPFPFSATFTPSPSANPLKQMTVVPTPFTTTTMEKNQTTPPDIYYFMGTSLYKYTNQQKTTKVIDFPHLRSIIKSMRVQDEIAVLGDSELQLLNLNNLQIRTVIQFTNQPLSDSTIIDKLGDQLIYYIVFRDSQSDFGRGTIVGFYDFTQKSNRVLSQFQHSIRVLGVDQDAHSIFTIQVGQDPEFKGIDELDAQDGHVVGRIEVIGSNYAVLSPDKKSFATMWYHLSNPDKQKVTFLSIYNLSSYPSIPIQYRLPNPPSHVRSISWSGDSKELYYYLVNGNIYEDSTVSYGIWSLLVSSGETRQIASIPDDTYYWINIDTQWIILTYSLKNNSPILVNLLTGNQVPISLPEGAMVVQEMVSSSR